MKRHTRALLAMLFGLSVVATAQARGTGDPEQLIQAMARTLDEQARLLNQMQEILNRISHDSLFPRKSFWGVPVQWYASRFEPPWGVRNGRPKWRNRKQTLYLTTYLGPHVLSLVSDRYAARRQIGSILLENGGAEVKQVIFDMRSVQVFLFNSWSGFRFRGDVGGEALQLLLRKEQNLPRNLAHAGPFDQGVVPTHLYNPDDTLLESLGVPKKERKKVLTQILAEWDRLIPLHRKQRKMWQQTFSAIRPQPLMVPHILPKQERFRLGVGGVESGRYVEAILNGSKPFTLGHADSITDEAPAGNNFVELHVADAIARFRVLGNGSERVRRAATFESILESFVEKGRAVRKPAQETPYARMVRLSKGEKGWIAYEGVPQPGKYQGVILYRADSGEGYWITSAAQAVEQLRPSVEEFNRLQQKLRQQVFTYNALVIRKAVRAVTAHTTKQTEQVQDAF